jgi:hypothetical protein
MFLYLVVPGPDHPGPKLNVMQFGGAQLQAAA